MCLYPKQKFPDTQSRHRFYSSRSVTILSTRAKCYLFPAPSSRVIYRLILPGLSMMYHWLITAMVTSLSWIIIRGSASWASIACLLDTLVDTSALRLTSLGFTVIRHFSLSMVVRRYNYLLIIQFSCHTVSIVIELSIFFELYFIYRYSTRLAVFVSSILFLLTACWKV